MQADLNTGADNMAAVAGSGALLREAREQRQLTVEDVAHTLRLTPQIILALESGEFGSLGPAVFVRGYLRNYAKLLELPPHLALAESPTADVEPEAFRTMSIRTEIKPGINLHGWLLWSLLGLALLIIVLILIANRPESVAEQPGANAPASTEAGEPAEESSAIPQSAATEANAPAASGVSDSATAAEVTPDLTTAPAESTNAAAGQAAAFPAVTAESAPAQEITEPASASADELPVEPLAAATNDASITSATDKVALRLTFTDECWVEIADSRRSLLYGLEKGGSVVDLEGVPPFKIFVGNRDAVQVAIAGQPFPIPPGSQDDGNTARFTVANEQLR